MAVKLVKGDFWANIESHQQIIRRYFDHMFSRFPDDEGRETMYADLLMWFHDKKILEKFDPERGSEEKSDEKKWNLFLSFYIMKFLEKKYFDAFKYRRRFSADANVEHYNRKSYPSLRKPEVMLFDEEEDSISRRSNNSLKRKPRTTRINQASIYPTIDDLENLHSNERHSFDDEIEASDLAEAVRKQLKDGVERQVFEGCMEGLTRTEIAAQINRTPAGVACIMKRIKARCESKKILA